MSSRATRPAPRAALLLAALGLGACAMNEPETTPLQARVAWPDADGDMIREAPEQCGPWAGGMEGGADNPLGARALYLFQGGEDTLYRIHGTNEVWSIGKATSAGCIRLYARTSSISTSGRTAAPASSSAPPRSKTRAPARPASTSTTSRNPFPNNPQETRHDPYARQHPRRRRGVRRRRPYCSRPAASRRPRRGAGHAGIDEVHHDHDGPVQSDPEGDVTIVEYFECPYCKANRPILPDVVARDGNARLVMKDWPIFGAPSVQASQLALGAVELGSYEHAHNAPTASSRTR